MKRGTEGTGGDESSTYTPGPGSSRVWQASSLAGQAEARTPTVSMHQRQPASQPTVPRQGHTHMRENKIHTL